MKILRRIGLAILAIVLLFVVVGFLLPREFKVQREVKIYSPYVPVYQMISAPTEWPKWSVWNKRDPNMSITYSGPASGKGAKWVWKSKTEGDGEMEFTAADSPRKIVYVLRFPDMGMVSTGELNVIPENDQLTRLTWSNTGDFGYNPALRYLGLFMDRIVGPDFEAGLSALKVMLEARAAEAAKEEAKSEAAKADEPKAEPAKAEPAKAAPPAKKS
jgi:uncharacterized protein YndB with AHSA1/START domain